MYNDDFTKAYEYSFLKELYTDEELQSAKDNTKMIHYAGGAAKPWRMKKPYEDYQKYINKLPKELRKTTFRDFRKKLFSKD